MTLISFPYTVSRVVVLRWPIDTDRVTERSRQKRKRGRRRQESPPPQGLLPGAKCPSRPSDFSTLSSLKCQLKIRVLFSSHEVYWISLDRCLCLYICVCVCVCVCNCTRHNLAVRFVVVYGFCVKSKFLDWFSSFLIFLFLSFPNIYLRAFGDEDLFLVLVDVHFIYVVCY